MGAWSFLDTVLSGSSMYGNGSLNNFLTGVEIIWTLIPRFIKYPAWYRTKCKPSNHKNTADKIGQYRCSAMLAVWCFCWFALSKNLLGVGGGGGVIGKWAEPNLLPTSCFNVQLLYPLVEPLLYGRTGAGEGRCKMELKTLLSLATWGRVWKQFTGFKTSRTIFFIGCYYYPFDQYKKPTCRQ